MPAVAEPLIVWILSGSGVIEEREFGGTWISSNVKVGDFFLTNSDTPYEMRWHVTGPCRFEVMHVFLSLPIFEQAAAEIFGVPSESVQIRDVSGEQDRNFSFLLEQNRGELTSGTIQVHYSFMVSLKAWQCILSATMRSCSKRVAALATPCPPSNCAASPS